MITEHNFSWGEETYTICVSEDDWSIDESLVDMSEAMMKAGTEFALEHGMVEDHISQKHGTKAGNK